MPHGMPPPGMVRIRKFDRPARGDNRSNGWNVIEIEGAGLATSGVVPGGE